MIYLDYAASSPVLPPAADMAVRFMTEEYANPSSIHQAAEESRAVIDRCRRKLADMLGCSPTEIIFTSGGTESNNLAVFGADSGKTRCLITTAIEHESVLRAAEAWESAGEGRSLRVLKPDDRGIVSAEQTEEAVLEALSSRAGREAGEILVSVMTANNELGTIEPIREIGAVCRKYGVLFHTDAVQAFGHIPIDVRECGIGLLSASGHKFGAPKGVGFLYKAGDVPLCPILFGGGQERTLRSGTLNTPGIAGMLAAAEYCETHMAGSAKRIFGLRNAFLREILTALPDTLVNSPLPEGLLTETAADNDDEEFDAASVICLPGHLNLCFPGIEAETLLIHLDLHGVAASAASACASGSLEPSHVLTALPGMTSERANASLRLSFGEFTTEEECAEAAETVIQSVKMLRKLRCGVPL